MASRVQTSGIQTGSTTLVYQFGSTPTVGNTIVIRIWWSNNATLANANITDDATGGSNSYTVDVQRSNGVFPVQVAIISAKIDRTKAPLTVTIAPSGTVSDIQGVIEEWSGMNNVVDKTAVSATPPGEDLSSPTAVDCGTTATTTSANATAFAVTGDQYGADDRTYAFNDSRSNPATGWVKDGEILTGLTRTTGTAGHVPLTATGAIRCTIGVNSSGHSSACAVAVYPDGGSPPAVAPRTVRALGILG